MLRTRWGGVGLSSTCERWISDCFGRRNIVTIEAFVSIVLDVLSLIPLLDPVRGMVIVVH